MRKIYECDILRQVVPPLASMYISHHKNVICPSHFVNEMELKGMY